MQSIAPCRSQVSDRFPIASFDIALPRSRYFEVACATDPRLFHSEWKRQRTTSNFFTSRAAGLLLAPEGRTAWFLPPGQLRRFAGAQRIYYALASYGNPMGAEPEFSISPHALERVPSIGLAADFTGRTLDRSRLAGHVPVPEVYGGAADATLRWGGDDALEAERYVSQSPSTDYDDGHGPELWNGGTSDQGSRAIEGNDIDPDQGAYDAGVPPEDHSAEFTGSLSALAEQDECHDEFDEGMAFGSAGPMRGYGEADSYSRSSTSVGQADALDDADDLDEDEEGYEDAAALYGAVGFDSAEGGTAVLEPGAAQPVSDYATEYVSQGRDPGYREEMDEDELLPAGSAARALSAIPFDIAEKVRILRVVGIAESGADGYAAINPDNEYNDPNHPAYHKYHIGLSWGLIQFTQRSGALGKVLKKVQEREAKLANALAAEHTFAALFGPHANDLIATTTASDPDARVAPVGGALLWESSWTARFRAAGAVPHVMWSQNEVAVTDYVDPLLQVAAWLGFDTPRSLALLIDRCIHMGKGGGLSWVMRTIGPLQNEGDRDLVLRALGHADLRAFQSTFVPALKVDGRWGPLTHAAMTAALRGLGSSSPLAVDGVPAMQQMLVDAARNTRFHKRVKALHENTTDLSDNVSYVLV